MDYFWNPSDDDEWRPDAIRSPDELGDGPRLNICCTQTELTPAAQRKLVRSWCEVLPSLAGIEYLWFSSRVPQDLFDAACAVPGLKGLWVKWSGIKSVAAIEHATALECFHLGSSSGLQSIEPLSEKTKLRWLSLENIKRITRLEPLVPLQKLIGLQVEGSMWTTQRVETLAPIGELTGLRYLAITNLRTKDKTLRPLFSLRKLESFSSALWWPDEEFEELKRRNPKLKGFRM